MIAEMRETLQPHLDAILGREVELSEPVLLAGGASKEAWAATKSPRCNAAEPSEKDLPVVEEFAEGCDWAETKSGKSRSGIKRARTFQLLFRPLFFNDQPPRHAD